MPDQELVVAPAAPVDPTAAPTTAAEAPDPEAPDPEAPDPEAPEADALVVERGLDDLELAVLELERRTYRHQGAKEQAVRDELDLSATRYYQVLNALLDDPAALAREPVLVGRARRLRDERLARAAR